MTRVRKDVWKLGSGWNDTLLWYARGVAALQTRPIKDPTSWRYLAAMHGFDPGLWTKFSYLADADELPGSSDQARDWKQCQHQSWYFVPWHRGYVAAFESLVAAAVAAAGGPGDWALPYWNYSDANDASALQLPDAFQQAALPDGAPNPLKIERRYGDGTGTIVITAQDVDLRGALVNASRFSGSADGGGVGFGGPHTSFSHDGNTNGALESRPHNGVHGLVGGQIPNSDPQDPANYGLMSMPDTAALDPIFWLHHANIDRLWDVWLKRDPRHRDDTSGSWLNGPTDRTFFMPDVNGASKGYAPKDMLDTRALGYEYDDTSDPFGGASLVALRMERLRMSDNLVVAAVRTAGQAMTEPKPAEPKPAELVGANNVAVQLDGGSKETQLELAPAPRRTIVQSFSRMQTAPNATPTEPDRVFLNLENIRGVNDAALFTVYVGLAAGADPAAHPQNLAGTVSLFGVRKATRQDGPHGGNGINEVLDITHIVDAMHLGGNFDVAHLNVQFVPRTALRAADQISIGRVSVYRQGQ